MVGLGRPAFMPRKEISNNTSILNVFKQPTVVAQPCPIVMLRKFESRILGVSDGDVYSLSESLSKNEATDRMVALQFLPIGFYDKENKF